MVSLKMTGETMEYVRRAIYGENHPMSHMMHDKVHGAMGGETLCGKRLGPMWFIVGDERCKKQDITCKACLKAND